MTLIDDLCDGCGSRFDPMGDPVLTKHPEIGPYAVYCATCEHKAKMTDATELDDEFEFNQCPHEVIRATCPSPCRCGCAGCKRFNEREETRR